MGLAEAAINFLNLDGQVLNETMYFNHEPSFSLENNVTKSVAT